MNQPSQNTLTVANTFKECKLPRELGPIWAKQNFPKSADVDPVPEIVNLLRDDIRLQLSYLVSFILFFAGVGTALFRELLSREIHTSPSFNLFFFGGITLSLLTLLCVSLPMRNRLKHRVVRCNAFADDMTQLINLLPINTREYSIADLRFELEQRIGSECRSVVGLMLHTTIQDGFFSTQAHHYRNLSTLIHCAQVTGLNTNAESRAFRHCFSLYTQHKK